MFLVAETDGDTRDAWTEHLDARDARCRIHDDAREQMYAMHDAGCTMTMRGSNGTGFQPERF